MAIPSFRSRTPEAIIAEHQSFDSAGRIFRALSWLDYAKVQRSISALEYSALETRLGIEQLVFEQLVVGVGTELDAVAYEKCSGSAKRLNQLIDSLIPRYDQLIKFTQAMAPKGLPITKWDNRELVKQSGRVSQYLHWSGGLDVTMQSSEWLERGLQVIDAAANYVWTGLTSGNTGVMNIRKLEPEMRELWELYANDEISIESAIERADTLEPLLQARLNKRT